MGNHGLWRKEWCCLRLKLRLNRIRQYGWLFLNSPVALRTGLVAVALFVFVWGATLYQTNQDYITEINGMTRVDSFMSRAFEEYVRRNLQAADELLSLIGNEYEESGGVTPEVTNLIKNRGAFFAQQLSILNKQGHVVVSYLPVDPALNFSGRNHFLAQKRNKGLGLYVGVPRIGEISGVLSIYVSRRINYPDGSFGGVVAMRFTPQQFSDFFHSTHEKNSKGIILLGRDGMIRAQSGAGNKAGGNYAAMDQLRNKMRQADSGSFYVKAEGRLYSYRVMRDYPLIAMSWTDENKELADFYDRKHKDYLWAALVSLFIFAAFGVLVVFMLQQQAIKEKLRQREEQYRQLVQDAECIIVRWDGLGRITFINEFGEKFFNAAIEELLGKPVMNVIGCAALPENTAGNEADPINSQQRLITEVERADGQKAWCEWIHRVLIDDEGVRIGGVGVGMDVTSRCQAQRDLQESEARLRAIIDNAVDDIFIRDLQGRYILVNKSAEIRFKRTANDILHSTVDRFFNKEAAEQFSAGDKRVLSGNIVEEENIAELAGRTYVFHTIKVPLRNVQGEIVGLCGISRDLTDRIHAEKELRYREMLLRTVSQCSELFLQGKNWEQAIQQSLGFLGAASNVSRVWLLMTDVSGDSRWYEWTGPGRMPIQNFRKRELSACWFEQSNRWARILQEGKPLFGQTKNIEFTEKGMLFDADTKSFMLLPVIVDGQWIGIMGFEDCEHDRDRSKTELEIAKLVADLFGAALARKRAEENALKATREKLDAIAKKTMYERLASIGTMVASVAHEVNQPLNALKVTVDGLIYWHYRGRETGGERVIETCQKISRYAERISKIVKHLRAFATYRPLEEKEPVDLRQAVAGAMELVGAQLKAHGIEVIEHLAETLPLMLGDLGRLEEMIINLLINAMQAVDGQGLPGIKQMGISAYCEQHRVILEIWDNGPGFDTEIMDKVFEPFFTTKSKGMGLGLSIVKSIVDAHAGTIHAANRKNGGAVFHIEFPCLESDEKS
jgi:PAS domain S-box-containing protein